MAASIRNRPSLMEARELTEMPKVRVTSGSIHRRRPNSGAGGTTHLTHNTTAVTSHYLQHRGSVKGDFTSETSNRFAHRVRRVWKTINSIGGSRKEYSLFLFHKNSMFRKNAKKIAKSRVFKVLMALLVLFHSAILAIYQPSINGDIHPLNTAIYYVTIAVVVLYMFEAGINIIAYGLIQSKKAYLRNPAHILDLFVILFGILYIAIQKTTPANMLFGEIFASFMAFKLIKLIALSENVKYILNALAKSFAPLFYLLILTFLVVSFLALIGVQLFKGRLHFGCYSNFSTPAGHTRSIRISDFPCDANGTYVGSHRCPHNSTCLNWEEGPHQGIISFDNLAWAYLVVFQVISLEGWVGILYLYEAALGYIWVWIYFVVVMFFGSIFILNLWTGVLTSVFLAVSEREAESGQSRKLREKKRIDEDLQNYNDWLKIAAEMDAPSDTGSILDRRHSFFMWSDPLDEYSDEETDSEEVGMEVEGNGAQGNRRRARVLWHKLRKIVRKAVKHKFFLWIVLTLRAVNLILLASLHFPSKQVFNDVIYALNYMFSVLYFLEFLLRVFSLSKKKYLYYWKNSLHLFEIMLTVLTVVDLVVFSGIQVLRDIHFGVFINTVWCLKLIMIVKHTRSWKGMKEILATVFQLLPSVLSLLSVVVIALFVYTILGLRLFGGRLSNTGIVEPNFDDIFKSFLLVFQLMTSEDWNNLLFTSLDYWINIRGIFAGGAFALYFFVGVAFGSFILLSVFLAMSVDKLSEVRSLRSDSDKQKEKTEKEREEKKQHLSELQKDNQEKPLVRRRTVRRVMRYLSGTATEAQAVGQLKRRKPFSLRLKGSSSDTSVSRSGSTPQTESLTSPVVGSELSSSSQSASPAKGSVKLRNPLRLVTKQKSEFFDQQRLRGAAIDSYAGTSKQKKQPVGKELSFDSAKRTSESDNEPTSPMYYERSHSSPVDTPISAATATFSDMPKLDPIEEVHRFTNSDEDNQYPSRRQYLRRQNSMNINPEDPGYPASPSAVDDQLFNVMRRGDSLTNFTPISDNLQNNSSKKKAAVQLKEKVWHVYQWMKDYVGTIQLNPKKELAKIPPHSSFFILSPDNRFREFCFRVVSSKAFSTITYVAVFISSLILTVEVPIGFPRNGSDHEAIFCTFQDVVIVLDCVFMAYFILEMILKMVALGVVFHKGSYLRGFFNIMDFLILVLNIIPIIMFFAAGLPQPPDRCLAYSYFDDLPRGIGLLRVFRVLRPLRAIRISGLYLVTTGLLSSIKSMFSIFFLVVLVLLVFSVSGVQLFRGRFWSCNDPRKTLVEECMGNYYVYDYTFVNASQFPGLPCPMVEKREWARKGLNFDNVGSAILTLFSMLTIEGWQNTMYAGLNAASLIDTETVEGHAPEDAQLYWTALYFLLYMVVMAFILVQLFTGFVIVTFQEDGVKSFREAKLERNERNCLYFALSAKPLRQYLPRFKLHQKFHKKMLPIVNHFITKFVIALALIVNCLLLGLVTYEHDNLNRVIYYFNIFFTVFFAMEAVLKIIVLTPANYFRNLENVIDFLIVLATSMELIVQLAFKLDPQYQYSHITSSFRVLRLTTLFPKIRLILWTVIKSLEIFPWVGFLLMIVFFIYTIIGMQVFGNIRRAPIDELTATREITEYNNFANFPQALLVMIRMATGENWQDIMLSCISPQLCERPSDFPCGNDIAAYFFFPSFYFFSSILILNLLVAIVIDNFDYILRDKAILGAHQLDVFVKLWANYDPGAKGILPSKTVMELMRQCDPPVGWGRLCPTQQAYKKMVQMNMRLADGEGSNVTFNATLFALVRTSLKIQCEGCPDCARKCNLELRKKLKILFPHMPTEKIDEVLPTENDRTVSEEYAALLVQRIWRAYIMKRRRVLAIFHGSKKVLKAGLRSVPPVGPDFLQRNTSDFEFQLPPEPTKKISQATFASTDSRSRSPTVFTPRVLTVDLEPSSPDRFNFQSATLSPTNTVQASPSLVDESREPFAPVVNRGGSPQAYPNPDMTPGPLGGHRLDSAGDNQSELSFTSAYSNPVGDFFRDSERMETTV